MKNLVKTNDNIYELTIPYKDIFTTVYIVRTARGALLFDTATYDSDVEEAIIPALCELGVGKGELKYIFISHAHKDHAGGLTRLLAAYPEACIVSRSEALREKYAGYNFIFPRENEVLLDVLSAVSVHGHTADSTALYDKRSKTLISGDCLQLYGIFGLGCWGANISFPKEYAEAIEKLRKMDIDAILTAHNYHPLGKKYFGEEIKKALDYCLLPFEIIKGLIEKFPDSDDEAICAAYNDGTLPRLGAHVIKAYRNTLG